MPIEQRHAGRRYPATAPYTVTAAKILEFAEAVGDDNTLAAAQRGDVVAPPTFAMVIAATAWESLFSDPELGLALRRTVHADQKFTWQRPLRPGDQITAVLSIDRVRTRGVTDLVTVTVSLSNQAEEQVATATSTLLHTREESADV